MAEYKQVYGKVDWNNAYRKEYGKYIKTNEFTWQQSGEGGGGERIFAKVETPEPKPEPELDPAPADDGANLAP